MSEEETDEVCDHVVTVSYELNDGAIVIACAEPECSWKYTLNEIHEKSYRLTLADKE